MSILSSEEKRLKEYTERVLKKHKDLKGILPDDILGPKLVIVNGGTNFKYFNQCVNIRAQPYKIIYNGKGGKIWKSCYKTKETYN